MTDENALLNLLEEALRVGPVEPPPARVQEVCALVTGNRPLLRAVPGVEEAPAAATPAYARAASGSVPDPRWAWADRRLTLVFSGVAAAALLVIAAVAALQSVPGSSSDRSTAVLRAQSAAYRLQVAIEQKDPAQVAKADADLLRTAETVAGGERDEAQRIAVPVHVQAIAFLRDHASPEVLSNVHGAASLRRPGPGGAPDAAVAPPTSVPAQTAPDGIATPAGPDSLPPAADSPTTTLDAGALAPAVKITGTNPRLDGDFEVNFTVSGLTPDGGEPPGPYLVRFSYDGGADPVTYTGESPWTLPLVKAILYRQVCADVVDSTGAVVPGSGTCTNIINL